MQGYSIPQIIKNLRKKMKEKGGVWSIEFVFVVFITLALICMLLDLFILMWKFTTISQTTNYMTRVISLQGGVKQATPEGYPGGSEQYLTIAEMREDIATMLRSGDIDEGEYRITINGKPFGSNVHVDYREDIVVEMEVDYKWEFMSNFIPGNIEHAVHSNRATISEYKYHYDQWVGE